MAGADVPQKPIPDDLEVPADWKEADIKAHNSCFYWTRKGKPTYKAACVVCGHSFNGINVARPSKTIRVGEREDCFVCGGTCWGTYMAMDQWERCPCGICVSWCQYIEKLKDSASAAPMYIANQGVESGRAGLGSPRTLKEIMQQNTRLLEQQENLRGLLVELLELEEELSPQSASWLQTTRRAFWSAESCELAPAWRGEGGTSVVVLRI